jgi:hypothetical protein
MEPDPLEVLGYTPAGFCRFVEAPTVATDFERSRISRMSATGAHSILFSLIDED